MRQAMQPVTDPEVIRQLEESSRQPVTDPQLIQQLENAPSTLMGKVAGAGEVAGTLLSGAIAEPLSGLAGLASLPFVGANEAANVVRNVSDHLTYQPKTPEGRSNLIAMGNALEPVGKVLDKAQQITGDAGYAVGGPLGGAIGATVPAAVLEMPLLRGAKLLSKRPSRVSRVGMDSPDPKDYQTVTKNLKENRTDMLAEGVDPDSDILNAAEALDIELTPGATSQNRAFIDTEQSLKSRPGSQIAVKEEKAIRDLSERADALVNEMGGTTDKSLLDAGVRDTFTRTVDDMTTKSDDLYRHVESVVSPATEVSADAVRRYLAEKLRDLGSDESLLTLAEKRLKTLVDDGQPTYAALDRVRKNVGEGFKRRGVFADDEIGTLEQVYSVLIRDQKAAADTFGVGREFKLANDLVFERKALEKRIVSLYGKNFQGSLINNLNAAATALPKGDVSHFTKLVDAVPEGLKQEVAATVLNDLFTAGSRNRSSMGAGFVKAYEGLSKNVTAKRELFKYLPEGAEQRFDQIGKVATGIYRAKALENTSKTARDVIAAMDDGGLFNKVYSVSKQAAAAEIVSSTVGFPGAGSAGVIGATLAKSRTPATQAADALIASDKFSKAVKAYAIGRTKQADELIKNSQVFKQWAKHLPKSELDKITARGFVPWLVGSSGLTQGEEQ